VRGLRTLAVLLGAATAVALTATFAPVMDRPVERRPGPPPKVFAFVSNHGGAELRRLEAVGARIDVIAPNWYGLDAATGELHGPGRPGPLIEAAAARGVGVWPTVNALTGGSRAWERPRTRARIVRSLMAAATGPGAAGVTLDMEELRRTQRAAFTALVGAAAAALRAADRRLAVYVPRPGPGGGAAYDWAELAAHADLLLTSGYNEHWARSRPGATTTGPGFAAVVDRALDLAGPRKAVPVLGAFGYRWPQAGPGRLISTVDAQRLRRRLRRTAARSDGSARFRSGEDTVIYETTAGLRSRAAAARAAGARWIGLFTLGREPAAFWDGLKTNRMPASAASASTFNSHRPARRG